MSRDGSGVRIEHDCGSLEPRRDLREQLKPFSSKRCFEAGEAGDVSTRAVEPIYDALGDGITHIPKDDRDRPRLLLEGNGVRGPVCHYDVGLQADQLLRERSYPIDVTAAPPNVHPHVAAIGPTQVRKRLRKRREASLLQGIVFFATDEHTDAPHALALLRTRRDRPYRRAAEK